MVWLWCAVSDTVPAAPPQEYGNYQEAEMHLRHTLELRPRFQPAQAALRQMEAAPSTKVQRSTVCIILVLVSSARSCAVLCSPPMHLHPLARGMILSYLPDYTEHQYQIPRSASHVQTLSISNIPTFISSGHVVLYQIFFFHSGPVCVMPINWQCCPPALPDQTIRPSGGHRAVQHHVHTGPGRL